MAKIPLKEITFPGLDNTYTIPEIDNTLSTAGKAADAKKTGDEISELKEDFATMESDGVVPSAEQILTDKGITDSVPYHYRKTGGNGADREYDQIVGGTVAWNQLVQNANKSASFVTNETNYSLRSLQSTMTLYADTVYLINIDANVSSNGVWRYRYPDVGQDSVTSNTRIIKTSVNSQLNTLAIQIFSRDGQDATFDFDNIMFFDLTAMFGSTIADYIYQLERTTAGAGVAFFKSLFPNDYYPYDAGTLKSVEGLSEHKMVGFNQWDEEVENGYINPNTGAEIADSGKIRMKNYIPVLPNTTYYKKTGIKSDGTAVQFWNVYFDENKNYIGYGNPTTGEFTTSENCHYIRSGFETTYGTTYKNDICINLSDPAKNGTYEPYKAHSYPLDDSLTLRGLFKLDANNNLYADGDTYEYTGKVTRNTILRAYQSGDESLANAITDGTNTVVYSANASTEEADPYQHLQQCDPSGTEEYVSTGIVPVGHNSFYPENLRAKVEQLPWNFASLIAPTEATFTATRNYTTGALFIVDNVLYKATSNIANGGTITPNTNCTATTLAEIISALA